MKCMFFIFLLGVFLYCAVAWAGVTHRVEEISDPRVRATMYPGEVRLSSNRHSEQINVLIMKSLLSRFPKNRPYLVSKFRPFTNLHGLIMQSDCYMELTGFKTKDQLEAIQTTLQYYQAYIDTFNNTREIRPYLYEFPISINHYNLSIGFAVDPSTNHSYRVPYLSGVSLMPNFSTTVSVFQYPETKSCWDSSLDVYDNCLGPFPEALKAMNVPRLEKTDKEKPIVISQAVTYFGPTDSCKDEFLFAIRFAKENKLKMIATMNAFGVGMPTNKKVCCDLVYAAQELFLSIDQARELLLKIRNEHAAFYRTAGRLVRYVNEARKKGEEVLSPTIDAQQYLGFRVSFWDKYIDRVKAPYIAEIQFYGKKARYYVADELQRLQLVLEEELPSCDVEVPCPAELTLKKEKP